MTSFDLLTRPWVPVLTTTGSERLSLREALARAREVQLAGTPDEHTALLRVLLAAFAAAARPTDAAQWDAAWQAPDLDAHRVGRYLDAHADRFDLFSATRPFWQSADLSAGNRDARVLEVESWGSGTAQFAARLLAPAEPMEAADAAVGLVLLQTWHPGGIQSGHPADPATRGNRLYGGKPAPLSTVTHVRITGACLKDELLLNLPPGPRDEGDRPVWERASPAAPMVQREPGGPLDVWTWPTRRLRLLPDEVGRVGAVAVYDGDRPADPGAAAVRWDPGAAVNGRGGRLAVADAAGQLLPWAAAGLLGGGEEGAGRCLVLEHIVAAAERGVLPPGMPVEAVLVRAEHTTSHRAALSGIVHLRAPLGPARMLANPAQRAALVEAARLPWAVQRQVTRTAAETLHLLPKAAPARAELSVAAHLGAAWEEFADEPHGGMAAWVEALTAAVRRASGSGAGGSRLLATARITTTALGALPHPTDHSPASEPQGATRA
ncbi:type I-E CRISPR-associated protein Cse1/CasA [Streptomyces sp. NPDC001407]|uniref:type I-E CRISPR-associated protein Cse1/CasA n=1 Tax=Streptomyces sp. NPDC001407 TaxID=3364573 RepID=UPI0036C2A3C1